MAPPAPNILITNDGAKDDLDCWRSRLNLATIRLFDVFHVPTHADTPASYHEASFVGYARITAPGFGAVFLNGFGKAETDSGVCTWTFTAGAGSAMVYGWYMLDATGLMVLMATQFNVPVTLTPGVPSLSRVVQATAVSEL